MPWGIARISVYGHSSESGFQRQRAPRGLLRKTTLARLSCCGKNQKAPGLQSGRQEEGDRNVEDLRLRQHGAGEVEEGPVRRQRQLDLDTGGGARVSAGCLVQGSPFGGCVWIGVQRKAEQVHSGENRGDTFKLIAGGSMGKSPPKAQEPGAEAKEQDSR